MYKMLATLNVKPGMLAATLAASEPFVQATRKEPGCIGFDLYRPVPSRRTSAASVYRFELIHRPTAVVPAAVQDQERLAGTGLLLVHADVANPHLHRRRLPMLPDISTPASNLGRGHRH